MPHLKLAAASTAGITDNQMAVSRAEVLLELRRSVKQSVVRFRQALRALESDSHLGSECAGRDSSRFCIGHRSRWRAEHTQRQHERISIQNRFLWLCDVVQHKQLNQTINTMNGRSDQRNGEPHWQEKGLSSGDGATVIPSPCGPLFFAAFGSS